MNEMKSAVIVGTAYPYRGGLAGINQTLARTFIRCGIRCRIFTFTVQYPSFYSQVRASMRTARRRKDSTLRGC